jgi:hypothetical protein
MVWECWDHTKFKWEGYGIRDKERKRPQQLKTIFLGEPQEGGVNLLGGRNKRGKCKEWRGINEKMGVGSP